MGEEERGRGGDGGMVSHCVAEVPAVRASGATRRGRQGDKEKFYSRFPAQSGTAHIESFKNYYALFSYSQLPTILID